VTAAEKITFYDEHPFDWISPDASANIRSVVSPPLVDLIETLDSLLSSWMSAVAREEFLDSLPNAAFARLAWTEAVFRCHLQSSDTDAPVPWETTSTCPLPTASQMS